MKKSKKKNWKKNKWLYIIGGIVAVVLICVLLVGLLNGVWPWTQGGYFVNYKGTGTPGETEQTTETTEENTKGTEPDGTDSTEGTAGSGSTDNNGGNSQGGNSAGVEDTDIKIPIGEISGSTTTENDTSGSTGTESTEGTDNTESTEQTEATGSSGKIPGQEISFDDLLDRID